VDPRTRWQQLQSYLAEAKSRLDRGSPSEALPFVEAALTLDPGFVAAVELREIILRASASEFPPEWESSAAPSVLLAAPAPVNMAARGEHVTRLEQPGQRRPGRQLALAALVTLLMGGGWLLNRDESLQRLALQATQEAGLSEAGAPGGQGRPGAPGESAARADAAAVPATEPTRGELPRPARFPDREPMRTTAANAREGLTGASTTGPLHAGSATPVTTAAPAHNSAEDDDRLVREVLQQYRSAYDRLDAMSVHAVWSSANTRALARAFNDLTFQQLLFDDCGVELRGQLARATCRGVARYVRRVGGGDLREEARQWTFALRKHGPQWMIQSARVKSR